MKRVSILVAALAIVAAACGGSTETEGVASLSQNEELAAADVDPEVDAEEAFLAFTECMRQEGVDLPDPQTDGEGNFFFEERGPGNEDLDRGELRAAGEACQQHLEGITQTFRNFDRTEIEDTLFEFASCMRDNGYDMPDPDLSDFGPGQADGPDDDREGAPGGGPFGELDQDDPAFQTAIEACEELLGGLRRGPGGGGPGSGDQGGDA